MKILRLVFIRILMFFKTNKLIFTLFILGGMICSITFTYFYGNLITSKSLSGGNEAALRNYNLYLNEPLDELSAEQEGILQEYPLDMYTYKSVVPYENLKCSDMGESFQRFIKENTFFMVETSLLDINMISRTAGRVQFTDEENNIGNEYVVILPPDFLKSPDLGSSLVLNGKEYHMIGISGNSNNLYIPKSIFEREHFKIDAISIMLSNALSDRENAVFEEKLQKAFPNAEIYGVSELKNSLSQRTPFEILKLAAIYLLAILSFMFLMKFMINAHSSEDIIYALTGASRKTVIKIILLQNTILSLFTGLIGIILHIALKSSLFEMINIQPNIQYHFLDYLYILIMLVAISVIVQIPFIWNYFRYSLVNMKQKYVLED